MNREGADVGPVEEGGLRAGMVVIGQGSMDQMRTVRRWLGEGGLPAELVAPPEGCGSS